MCVFVRERRTLTSSQSEASFPYFLIKCLFLLQQYVYTILKAKAFYKVCDIKLVPCLNLTMSTHYSCKAATLFFCSSSSFYCHLNFFFLPFKFLKILVIVYFLLPTENEADSPESASLSLTSLCTVLIAFLKKHIFGDSYSSIPEVLLQSMCS